MLIDEAKAILNREIRYKRLYEQHLYDFELKTLDIAVAQNQLVEYIELALKDVIDETGLVTAIHQYFGVVYDTTYEQWKLRIDTIKQNYRLEHPEFTHLPIECVKISSRELDYIQERWNAWAVRENERTVCEGFDNDIGEQDYSYIELPDTTIRKSSHVMDFGKYAPDKNRGRVTTVNDLIKIAPKYLIWMHENTQHKLSDELIEEAKEAAKRWQYSNR